MRRAALTALLLASAACIPDQGPMMKPGDDCLGCHGGGGAKRWTVAGTWTAQGQHVGIVDADGKSFSLHTNKAGNFWSSEPVTFPLQVSVDGAAMADPVAAVDASCNRCHGNGPGSGVGDGGGG
jgi:YD repeat-containing protein